MPLHLLAKKSWNVYNTQNIERVRQDEEAARKKEEEEEMRMQREDGERRLMELRRRMLERKDEGVIMGGYLERGREEVEEEEETDGNGDGSKAVVLSRREEHRKLSPSISTCPTINPQAHSSLIDHHGHINLFSNRTSRSLSSQDKNPEYEKEKAEKEAKLTEQYSLSLGKPAQELRPWYVSLDKIGEKQGRKTQEQVGVEKKRDEKFKDLNDPMAVMRRGIKQLREVEEGRRKVEEERKGELERLKVEQEEEGLEGFSLDDGVGMGLSCKKEKEKKRRGCRSRSKDHKSKRDNIHKRHRRERSKSPEGGSEHRQRRKRTTFSKDNDRQRHYRDREERNSTERHHHQSRNRSRSRRRDRKERDDRVHADRHDDCGDSAGKRKDEEYHHRGRESRSTKYPRGDER